MYSFVLFLLLIVFVFIRAVYDARLAPTAPVIYLILPFCQMSSFRVCWQASLSSTYLAAALYAPAVPPSIMIIRIAVSTWLSAAAKNSKSDDPNGHRFCDKKSVTQKVSKTHAQHSFLSLLYPIRFGCGPASVFVLLGL